mmetsp:Transcript_10809/g.22932  ORF Transcript_10809/g.22932 Transcript_10809/m.22932 type:complete len:344 (+) Transcript_10809:543-1574(+)
MDGGIRTISAISGMATAAVHGAGGVQVHLLLGMGTSDDGTVRGVGLWGRVGLLYLDPSAEDIAFTVGNIHHHIHRAEEYYIGHSTRIPISSGPTLRHGRNPGSRGMVDGSLRIGRRSTRRPQRNSRQSLPARGASGHGRRNVLRAPLDRTGGPVVPGGSLRRQHRRVLGERRGNVGAIVAAATIHEPTRARRPPTRPNHARRRRVHGRPDGHHHPLRRLRRRKRRRKRLQHLPPDGREADSVGRHGRSRQGSEMAESVRDHGDGAVESPRFGDVHGVERGGRGGIRSAPRSCVRGTTRGCIDECVASGVGNDAAGSTGIDGARYGRHGANVVGDRDVADVRSD